MQELRWILLLAGVLFLIVLAAWEMLRARRNAPRRELFPHLDRELPREPLPDAYAPDTARSAARGGAEPALGSLPDGLVESPHLDGAAVEPIRAHRAGPPLTELPQVSAVHVDVADDSFSAITQPVAAVEPVAAEPAIPESAIPAPAIPEPVIPQPAIPEAAIALAEASIYPADAQESALADVGAAPGAQPAPASPAAPRVEWPPDGERQILSVRIVSSGEQRLAGRSIRQALAASGFVHGRYHIFHQAAEDGRVLLSCASLNKPGNFDPASMDFQRYSGLSIFTVLPGPLPAQVALERLLTAGRDVSQRLQARLLDERGEPLDSTRIAALRAGAAAGAAAGATGTAAGTAAGTAGGAVGRTVMVSAVGGEPRA